MDHRITKRALSALLAASMIVSAMPSVLAAEEARDEELIAELLSYSEDYPGGAFGFREGKLSAGEDEGTTYVDVVRYGSFDGDADVTFKALDVSAKYGKDYTLSVDEGLFMTRELVPDEDARPLMEMYEGADGELVVGEQVTEKEEADNKVELSLDEEGGNVEITSDFPQTEDKDDEEVKGIRAGAAAYTGQVPEKHTWQEVTGAQNEDAARLSDGMDNLPEYMNELGEGVPGTECKLHFADGEYLKRIKVSLIADGVSETDEQVAFLLYSAENADVAHAQSAYLNILDSDGNEDAVFYIEENEIVVTPSESYAAVTVRRDTGKEMFASVRLGTSSITAEPDRDYKSGSVEVIFPQGVDSRTVKIPIYNALRKEAVTLAASLDKESAYVDESRYAALITILPNYSEESMQQYSAMLSEAAGEDQTADVYVADADGEATLSASTSDTNYTGGFKNTHVESPRNATTSYGDYVTVLEGLDLRNAATVTVYFNTDGWYSHTYSYKDGCDTKTATKTYYDKQVQFLVGGKTQTVSSSATSQESKSVSITGFQKAANQSLSFQVRKTSPHSDGNHWVLANIEKVVITYNKITLSVDNADFSGNTYTEKTYRAGGVSTDQGIGYTDGKKMKLGEGYADGNNTVVQVDRFTSAVNPNVKNVAGQLTSANVVPKIGTNVYLAGWQYLMKNNEYSTELIAPDDLTLETLYSKRGNETYYSVRPVLKPYPSMIRFNNALAGKLKYSNSISNGKEIGVTMLDTLELTAIPDGSSGYAVDSFLLRGYLDSTSHASMGSKRANAVKKIEEAAFDTSDEKTSYNKTKKDNINTRRTDFLDSHKNSTNSVLANYNSADSNRITIMPNCEAIYIDMTYTTPKIDVRYNPSNAAPLTYKDMGTVFYVDEETKTSANGKYGTPMTVQPVNYGTTYMINAAYEDVNSTDQESDKIISDYKTIWQDFTGDSNMDGQIDPAEKEALARYNIDRSAFTGDAFVYRPKVTNSQIYYYFAKREKVRGEGGIYGTVFLKDHPVFGNRASVLKPLNDAGITIDGKSAASHYDEDFGGQEGKGGDGYFEIYDNSFVAGEAHRVSVVYGPLSVAGVSNVNVASDYILDAYDTINIDSASIRRGDTAIKHTDPIYNEDKNYTFTFGTVSNISAKVAKKATMTFYRADGSIVGTKDFDSTTDTSGVFECTFNPASLSIPPGATATVKFTDNDGVEYFEHDLGITFTQSLGKLSLMTSFAPGTQQVFAVLGAVSTLFNLGWDGNIDDDKGGGEDSNYSITTTNEEKVLTLNLKLQKKKDFDKKDKEKKDEEKKDEEADKGEEKEVDESGAVNEDSLKKAASGESSEEKKKELADKADKKKEKSKTKVSNSLKLELTFGFKLTLKNSTIKKGYWYFDEFMIIINAGAEFAHSTKYVTPIGISITVGVTVGAKATAIIAVERVKGREYYMADLMNGDNGTVDLVNTGMKMSDYMYTYGDFTVAPYIELFVEVGWTGFGAKLTGKADFSFNYNTKTEVFKGDVQFTASLEISLLFFSKKWKLGDTGKINLFSTGGTSELLGSDIRLNESLEGFEISDRENLKNRSKWNPRGDAELMAVAGYNETDLMSGVNAASDTKILPFGDGKYLAVFVDDDPSRNSHNSLAVYYTVFDGSSWSQPQIVEDDGTVDDAPALADVGDGRIFVAWSSANRVFDTEPGVIEALNARNIRGRFFDKSTGAFEDGVLEVTKNTDEDYAGDIDPHIAYDSESKRMIIYYTKEEYSATASTSEIDVEPSDKVSEEPGVLGDLTYPTTLIAYRLYDTDKGEFIDYNTAEMNSIEAYLQDADKSEYYKENFYGQRFLSLAPTAIVDQPVDDSGYSESHTLNVISSAGNSYKPVIMETEAIGYNHLGLFAYVLDYDGKKDTVSDRDIFLQIYNFKEESISFPIMLTQNSGNLFAAEGEPEPNAASSLKFMRIGGEKGITFLTYLSDGKVKMINISENLSNDNVLVEDHSYGDGFYYINKTRESGYKPEETLMAPEATSEYKGDIKINNFDIRANDDYFYLMFTQSHTKPKDGIAEGSDEAADPANRVLETQVFMKRYDIKNNLFTNPVQVTETEGMNYKDIAFAVEGDGFRALATRCGSKIATMGENNKVLVPDNDNSTLCSISFKPDANVELRKAVVEEPNGSGETAASFEIFNGGIETVDGLSVSVKDSSGNELTPAYAYASEEAQLSSYDAKTDTVSLIGGEFQPVYLMIPVEEGADSAGFTATVKDGNGNELGTISASTSATRKLDIMSFDTQLTQRGTLDMTAIVANNTKVDSGEQTVAVTTEDGTAIYTETIGSLRPGETYTLSHSMEIDYGTFFNEKTAEDGSVEAETKLTMQAGGEQKEASVKLYATKEQMARLNAVESVILGAAEGEAQLSENTFDVTVEKGGLLDLEPQINAGEYKGGRKDDNNETAIDAQGVALLYTSGNSDVVKVYDNGFIEGVAEGTSSIDMAIIPIEYSIMNTESSLRYATLPESAIKHYTINVNVSAPEPTAAPRHSGGGGTPTNLGTVPTPKPTAEPSASAAPDATAMPDASAAPEATAKPSGGTSGGKGGKLFKDVNTDDWFHDAVYAAADKSIVSGVSEDMYEPNMPLTRAMFATMLHRYEGEPVVNYAYSFKDVPQDMWYTEAVRWAAAEGVITGYDENTFGPDDPITREQAVAMMYRYSSGKGLDVSYDIRETASYADNTQISDYAAPAFAWAVGRKVVNGRDDKTLAPADKITRAEIAQIFVNYIGAFAQK